MAICGSFIRSRVVSRKIVVKLFVALCKLNRLEMYLSISAFCSKIKGLNFMTQNSLQISVDIPKFQHFQNTQPHFIKVGVRFVHMKQILIENI